MLSLVEQTSTPAHGMSELAASSYRRETRLPQPLDQLSYHPDNSQTAGDPLSLLRLSHRTTSTTPRSMASRTVRPAEPVHRELAEQIGKDQFVLPRLPEQLPAPDSAAPTMDALPPLPPPNEALLRPWWEEGLGRPQRTSKPTFYVNLDTLVADALRYSPQLRADSDLPLVQEASIVETQSEFDVRTFIESVFTRTSNPVGNILETGGPSRRRDNDWTHNTGVRKRTYRGGALELAQQIGREASNSTFFDPPVQGNARLVLSFTQPLLRGSGVPYNTSRIVLARIDTRIAWDRLCVNVQDHLVRVAEAYWRLHLERARLMQQQRFYAQAQVIMDDLEGRRSIDSLRSQVVRAKAAVATRRSDLARVARNIRNAEARVRALVDAPELRNHRGSELVPLDLPAQDELTVDLQDASATALDLRPEINGAVKQIRSAATRLHVAENELMPYLNLVLQSYVAGIADKGDIAQAFADQFGEGEPTYSVGLQFELPLGRREARAVHGRRRIELRHLTSQLEATVVEVLTEVEIAAGEVETTFQELRGKYDAMMAAEEEVDYLNERWQTLPGEDRAASFVLEELLDAQERSMLEQYGFAQAQVAHTLSFVQLRRSTGTLLQHEGVIFQRFYDGCIPRLALQKDMLSAPSPGVDTTVESGD